METQIDKSYNVRRSPEGAQHTQERSAHELYKTLKAQRHDFEDHLSIMGVGELPDIFTIFDKKRDVPKGGAAEEIMPEKETKIISQEKLHTEVKDHNEYIVHDIKDMVDLHHEVAEYLSQHVRIEEIAKKSIEKRNLTPTQAENVMARLKETMSQKIMSHFLSEQTQILRAYGFDDNIVSEYVGWRLSDAHMDNPMKLVVEKDEITIDASEFCSDDAMEAYKIHLAKEKINNVEVLAEEPQKKEEKIVDDNGRPMTSDQIDRLYEKMLGE